MFTSDDIDDEGVFMDVSIVSGSEPMIYKKTKDARSFCAICGTKATGVNFDVLTCSSCKAFFRRNGSKPLSQFVCRLSSNCIVDERMRRQCTACRLHKCFAMGMVKERIRTQEENDRHRALVEENRRQRFNKSNQHEGKMQIIEEGLSPSGAPSPNLSTLSHADAKHINLLDEAFNESVRATVPLGYRIELGADLCQFINSTIPHSSCLINFLKNISHFQRLSVDSRLILLKNNTTPLLTIISCILKLVHDVPFIVLHPGPYDVNKKIENAYKIFSGVLLDDAKMLKLLLVTLVFCPSVFTLDSLMDVAHFDANSYKLIRNSFDFYTELFWLYTVNKSNDNEQQAVLLFAKMITSFLRLQQVVSEIHSIISCSIEVDQLHVMMQSILNLA